MLGLKVLNYGFLVSASLNGNQTIWGNTFNFKVIKAHSKAVLSLNVSKCFTYSDNETITTWNTQQYILEKTKH